MTNTLEKNREIDIAIGITMERYKLNRAIAFDSLRNYARFHRMKMIDLAKGVICGEKNEHFETWLASL